MNRRIPLGHIELDAGKQPVHAMHDFFLNYTFSKKANWEVLRLMLNIFLGEYARLHPGSAIRPIEGEIEVETQYKYYLDIGNPAKSQDFRIDAVQCGTVYFGEFQNRASTVPPVKLRAPDYQVQGMKHCGGKPTVQVWLLAEDAGVAGELASFLLGKVRKIRSEEVRRIRAAFMKSLRAFCRSDLGIYYDEFVLIKS